MTYDWPESSGGEEHRRHATDGGNEDFDRILKRLALPRCRRVLYSLDENDSVSMDDLTEAVAKHEMDDEHTPDDLLAIKRDLYHSVVPRLSDLDWIDYDPRSETVRIHEPPDELSRVLEYCRRIDAGE